MQKQPKYPIQKTSLQLFELLNISLPRTLKRAGLPQDLFEQDCRGLTGQQFYQMWDAMLEEGGPRDLPFEMAKLLAKGPFIPALFAFSCSPNIVTGLERLAVFKPLVAPVKLVVTRSETRVKLEIGTQAADQVMPVGMAAFELVYFLEICRNCTGADILPTEIGMPAGIRNREKYDRYFGRRAMPADRPSLTLTLKDAQRPLISQNDEMWKGFEKQLNRQLADQRRNTPMSVRVRNALMELLPAGQASVDAVSQRLLMSRRSLQRHLSAEGETFQKVLDQTRSDLSMFYLRAGELSVEEISYLLAYQDPNSFYRAFQSWTGLTPSQARVAPA